MSRLVALNSSVSYGNVVENLSGSLIIPVLLLSLIGGAKLLVTSKFTGLEIYLSLCFVSITSTHSLLSGFMLYMKTF